MSAPDFYNMIARERGAPDGWHWYSLKAVGGSETGGVIVVGAVAPIVTRGKNKGRPNWRRLDKQTIREEFVTFADYRAREAQWESDTGKCRRCGGVGRELESVSTIATTYRPCSRCRASGKAPAND